jgi:multidrug efflux system membrane fusion protein
VTRKSPVKPIALLTLAVLAAAGLYARFAPPTAAPAAAEQLVPVLTAQAERADVPLKLDTVGRSEAYESVQLKARVDGQVTSVPFIEGRHVKKGELLVQLDPATFAAQRRQAEAALARDQAQLAKAKADLLRYNELRGKGFVSEEKVNEVRTAADASAASVRADQAAAELAALQESYTTLRAPFDGIVGSRLVSPGTLVKNNDTVLTSVNRIKPLYVSFTVPEKYLPRLKAGLRGGPLPVQVSTPGGKRVDGQVRFIDNAVDAATGTILLKATLANDDEALTPGQFLNVSLAIELLRDAITVPAEAVQQSQDGALLFVADATGKVAPRKVKVSATQGKIAVIGEGLAAGETVVTDGQLRLQPGSRIDLKAQNTKPAVAPAAPATANSSAK